MPLLRVNGLACSRADRDLFSDLSFELDAGEALQLEGPNGCGKTTLLRAICGLTLPVEGEIIWRGAPVTDDPERLQAELHYVGHADGIKLELSARENLALARSLMQMADAHDLDAILERVRLSGLEDVVARRLSAGQRRRVALARLLVGRAALWLLDEPFTALDSASSRVMDHMLREHLGAGGLAVISSHHRIHIDGHSVAHLALGE